MPEYRTFKISHILSLANSVENQKFVHLIGQELTRAGLAKELGFKRGTSSQAVEAELRRLCISYLPGKEVRHRAQAAKA